MKRMNYAIDNPLSEMRWIFFSQVAYKKFLWENKKERIKTAALSLSQMRLSWLDSEKHLKGKTFAEATCYLYCCFHISNSCQHATEEFLVIDSYKAIRKEIEVDKLINSVYKDPALQCFVLFSILILSLDTKLNFSKQNI